MRLKEAAFRPLLKQESPDHNNLNHLLPNNNLSFYSKIVELTISLQLNQYLFDNDLLNLQQLAHRKFFSTETTLLKTVIYIQGGVDSVNVFGLVAIDF